VLSKLLTIASSTAKITSLARLPVKAIVAKMAANKGNPVICPSVRVSATNPDAIANLQADMSKWN
jgi:hypothetical protein